MLILFGIAIFYHLTGTLNLADASRVLSGNPVTPPLYLVSALFIAGFGLKAALMPFHAWLPDAHPSAPAPISAMLSGVVIKVLGIYALIRIFFNIFGLGTVPFFLNILLVLGTLSMIAGSFLALGQKDFKGFWPIHQSVRLVLWRLVLVWEPHLVLSGRCFIWSIMQYPNHFSF